MLRRNACLNAITMSITSRLYLDCNYEIRIDLLNLPTNVISHKKISDKCICFKFLNNLRKFRSIKMYKQMYKQKIDARIHYFLEYNFKILVYLFYLITCSNNSYTIGTVQPYPIAADNNIRSSRKSADRSK